MISPLLLHALTKKKILVTFFSQSKRILRNNRIPENLELDKRTKEDFIYFIQAVPVPVFLKLEKVGKCSKIKKQRQICSSNWITVFFSVFSSCLVSSTYTATAPAPQLSALLVAHISDVERCFSWDQTAFLAGIGPGSAWEAVFRLFCRSRWQQPRHCLQFGSITL